MSGLSRLRNMFRVPDLRNKVFFTIFIIFIFRLGSYIPVPYVDFKAIVELKKSAQGNAGAIGFLDLFSGAAVRAIEAAGGTTEVLPAPWGDRRPPARGNALTNR